MERLLLWCAILGYLIGYVLSGLPARAQLSPREIVSLNGQWQVGDSVGATSPSEYGHVAPVPGLAHSAVPAFADVDQFESRELLSNLVRNGSFSQADYDRLGSKKGYLTNSGTTFGIGAVLKHRERGQSRS